MLNGVIGDSWLRLCGIVLSAGLTIVLMLILKDRLPHDQGRAFAVDGEKSRGKARGAGVIFVPVFCIASLLMGSALSIEYVVYLLIIILSMLTGYLDDGASTPWNEYVKGALDLVLAIAVAVNYLTHNSNVIEIGIAGNAEVAIPVWLYGLLIVALVWVSINVVNCTDGVDGLSAGLTIITLGSFLLSGVADGYYSEIVFFIFTLVGYLWFNCNPSTMLMGDAGSRAMGMMIAIVALLSGHPLLFIPFTIVMILDGGLGLIKVSLLRFLKISILKNTKCPLHDQARKVNGWSNTQVDYRFGIIQILISGIYIALMNLSI